MDYEKKYKDALENMRKFRDALSNCEETDLWVLKKEIVKDIEYYFPELKESEDDRIRKEIISALKYANHNGVYDKHLAWLEKQGEKPQVEAIEEEKGDNSDKVEPKDYSSIDPLFFKTTDKPEPKFKVGEWVVYDHMPYQVVELPKEGYINLGLKGNGKIEFAPSPYCRHWTIADAEDGDILYDGINACIFRRAMEDEDNNTIWIDTYCGINIDDEFIVNDENECWCLSSDCSPATKEQRDILMKAMADAGWTFDFEKKELKEIEFNPDSLIEESYQQQANNLIDMATENPAWSEEDDYNVQCLAAKVTSDIQNGNVGRNQELIDWLKSIKDRVQPQNLWKPSEEQMCAFKQVYDWYNNNLTPSETLTSLYNDLKKLKGK